MTTEVHQPLRRSMTWALVTTTWARPGVFAAISIEAVAGAVGASIPTALQARAAGAGLGVGAFWGVTGGAYAALLTAPVLLAILAQQHGPEGHDLYLSGWSHRGRFLTGVAAAGLWSVVGLVVAAVTGALVGIGDAVRHGSSPVTAPERPVAPWWLLLTLSLITAALLSWGRSAASSVAISLGGAAAFGALLPLTWTTPARPMMTLWPMSPAWAATYDGLSYRLHVSMSGVDRAVVAAAWLAVALVLGARGLGRAGAVRS